MASSRFSRGPRIQPPPKVCKSKARHPPIAPWCALTGPQPDVEIWFPGEIWRYPEFNPNGRYTWVGWEAARTECAWFWQKLDAPEQFTCILVHENEGPNPWPFNISTDLTNDGKHLQGMWAASDTWLTSWGVFSRWPPYHNLNGFATLLT